MIKHIVPIEKVYTVIQKSHARSYLSGSLSTLFISILLIALVPLPGRAAPGSICPSNTKLGDYTSDQRVGLEDLMMALQVQAGLATPDINVKGEIDDDSRIGMREALYSMQRTSGVVDAPRNILFAHGINSEASHWIAYATVARMAGWNVFCTDVTPDGSIETRATELADFINTLDLEPDSLVTMGHSMGGLDLRYIITKGHDNPVSSFADAAAVIQKVYTIATPHKGHPAGGLPVSPAIEDLGQLNMQGFNRDRPYSNHVIDGRQVPLTALRFACEAGDENGDDGTVAVPSQDLSGAPHSVEVFPGEHVPDNCDQEVTVELGQWEEILVPVLDGTGFATDVFDIVFYEGNNCAEGEKGSFSSRRTMVDNCSNPPLELGPLTNLGRNFKCDQDEIRSVMIYPGLRDNTRIRVYDSADDSTQIRLSDDWTAIHLGDQDLTKAICIPTFEDGNSTVLSDKGITRYFRQGPDLFYDNRLDGKISKVSISASSLSSVQFYEGESCSQGLKAIYTDLPVYKDCTTSSTCENDEIRSILITPGVADDTIIKTYDSPSGSLSYDWFFVNRGTRNLTVPFCITGMQHSTSSREEDKGFSTYYRDAGGLITLNGHVSYIKIKSTKDSKFVFYEGDNCSQQVKGLFEADSGGDDYWEECTGYDGNGTCANDDIQSLLIQPGVLKGKDVRVYDDPDGTLNDDYTSIYRGWQTLDAPFCINGFEHDTSTREAAVGITINHHHDNGLNGKISFIKVVDEL